MKLLDQVRDVVRESIISYSTENATQKIRKVQGIPCLNNGEWLSESHCPLSPAFLPMAEPRANEKRKRQLKEESQLPFRQTIMIRMSIFQGRPIP